MHTKPPALEVTQGGLPRGITEGEIKALLRNVFGVIDPASLTVVATVDDEDPARARSGCNAGPCLAGRARGRISANRPEPSVGCRGITDRAGPVAYSRAMASNPPRQPASSSFWWIYAAMWLPYGASYVVVFLTTGLDLATSSISAVDNVVPAALWGVVVVRVCRRVPWSPARRARFFARQLGLAASYAVLWVASVSLVFTISASVTAGALELHYLQGWALQWTVFSGLLIYGTIASVCYLRDVAQRLRDEHARAERLETLRARAELEALRAQLQPHFMFNTLHSVMALVRSNPAAAETAIEELAGLLRYVLGTAGPVGAPGDSDDVRLEDELAFVETYLALEALRLGDRLRVERRIDPEALDCCVPALTLQPLVENAIKHAVAPRAAGGTLTIVAELSPDGADDRLHLEVRDDGPGADPRAVERSAGIGLRLVRQRIATRYRGEATLEVETAPGAGFAVRLRGPVIAALARRADRQPA